MERARLLGGLHAAMTMMLTSCSAGANVSLTVFYVSCAACLIGAQWSMMIIHKKKNPSCTPHIFTSYALWTAGTCGCTLALMSSYASTLARVLVYHTCLLSALFLVGQSFLQKPLEKAMYGVLLTATLAWLYAMQTELFIAYTLAALWSWWVIYDTEYHHATEDNACGLLMLVFTDLIQALFAPCCLPHHHIKRAPGLPDG